MVSGKLSLNDCLEEYRAAIVRSMRHDGNVVFDIGTSLPDFKSELCAAHFPTELIFDAARIKAEDGWKQIIKPEENFDRFK